MASVTFRTRFAPTKPRQFSFKPEGESRTQQQFKDECNVNNIMAKYRKTGLVTHLAKHGGHFGDFSGLSDYQECLAKLEQAATSFSQLPSELRARFENDPERLIEFLSDKNNDEEAFKFGLKVRPKKEAPSMQESFEKALEVNDNKRAAKAKKD